MANHLETPLTGPTSWLELSRAHLLHNLAAVRALTGGARIMAVLKANAYGAGAVGMAQILAEAGVDAFGVASISEAAALRRSGIAGMIVCLAYFTQEEIAAVCAYDLTASIFTRAAARLLAEQARALGRRAQVWVKVDTGLGRLGIPHQEAAAFLDEVRKMEGLEITGVFSTLTENPQRDPVQIQRLLAVRAAVTSLAEVPLSLASSHGILSLPASYLDVVRPGTILHGLEPSEPERMDAHLVARAGLRPIATWKAHVGQVKTVEPGEQIGYGSQPALTSPTRVATLAVGWADGYPAAASQGASVLIRGCRCPVLTVSANSTLVDAGLAPAAAVNDEAVLLGRQGVEEITAGELARTTGGSVYRALAAIPKDVPRLWH